MHLRLQSAMEYLLTYGWALLTVAIVIIAMFQLGFFSNSNFTPHSVTGACQAVHNAAGSSLAGQCNSAIPQYVAQFSTNHNSVININNPDAFDTTTFTITAWISTRNNGFMTIVGRSASTQGWNFLIDSASALGIRIDTSSVSNCANYPSSPELSDGRWHFVAAAVSLSTPSAVLYMDGSQIASVGSCSGTFNALSGGSFNIMGYGQGTGCCTAGQVADVQMYNTTLSSSEINALYAEGIGGVPIDPTHIIGWWPLNGNTNDYSGNGNNGVPTAISYNGSWVSGYAVP